MRVFLSAFLLSILACMTFGYTLEYNSSKIIRENGLWLDCKPTAVSYSCYIDHATKIFTSTVSCSYDSENDVYLVGREQKHSFNLIARELLSDINLEISYIAHSCGRLILSLNNCNTTVDTIGLGCPIVMKSIYFSRSCIKNGTNTLSFIADDCPIWISLGKGTCPSGCGPFFARMYTNYTRLQKPEKKSAEGSWIASEKAWNFAISCDNEEISAFLPPDASNLEVVNETGSIAFTVDKGVAKFHCVKNVLISFSQPELTLHIETLDERRNNSYSPGENATVRISSFLANMPAQASIKYENSECTDNPCIFKIPITTPLGLRTLVFFADDGNGHIGHGNITLAVENASFSIIETVNGTKVSNLFIINNTMSRDFSEEISFALPSDYRGNLRVLNEKGLEIDSTQGNGRALFYGFCPSRSTCSYSVVFDVAGSIIFFKQPRLNAEYIEVGKPTPLVIDVLLESENAVRTITATVENKTWDINSIVSLLPLEKKNITFERPTVLAHIGGEKKELFGSTFTYEIAADFSELIQILSAEVRAVIEKSKLEGWNYRQNVRARFDFHDALWAENSTHVILYASNTEKGRHTFTLLYDSSSMQQPPTQPTKQENKQEQDKAETNRPTSHSDDGGLQNASDAECVDLNVCAAYWNVCNSGESESNRQYSNESLQINEKKEDALSHYETEKPARISIFAPQNTEKGNVEILVLKNSLPAEGSVLIKSPSGREFVMKLSRGATSLFFDEPGTWVVSYMGTERTINIGAESSTKNPTSIPTINPKKIDSMLEFLGEVLPFFLVLTFLPILFVLFLLVSRYVFAPNLHARIEPEGIKIRGKGELYDVNISLLFPSNAKINAENASISDTIFGKMVKWRVPVLKGSESSLFRFSSDEKPIRVNITGKMRSGKEVNVEMT
ncbi:MAG: hypothetical protein QXP42_01460 [Candidatus Micrarchaeia archaeon]